MSKILKRKYKADRKLFKKDLAELVRSNRALGMLIIKTYTACQHRKHILRIWELLGRHPEAHRDYNDNLFGKSLTGRDEIFHSLFFVDKGLYTTYVRKIPEPCAMGDALAVAYTVLRQKEAK